MRIPTPPHFATHIGAAVAAGFEIISFDTVSKSPAAVEISITRRPAYDQISADDLAFAMSRDYTSSINTKG